MNEIMYKAGGGLIQIRQQKCNVCAWMELMKPKYGWGVRYEGHCRHPRVQEAFKKFAPKSRAFPGFIAFTEFGSCNLTIKTCPRWCPIKLETDAPEGEGKAKTYSHLKGDAQEC